jgi:predicted SAM-dependent methyltransferase
MKVYQSIGSGSLRLLTYILKRCGKNVQFFPTAKQRSVKKELFVNIGAGSFRHPDWRNVDKISDYYENVQDNNIINYDLLSGKPLPFKDASIDIIYSSHTIEHIDDAAVLHLLQQSYKKLKKGSIIRITCPDMDYLYSCYKRGDKGQFIYTWIYDYGDKTQLTKKDIRSLRPVDASIQQLFLWSFARQASIYHSQARAPLSDEQVDALFTKNTAKAFDACTKKCSMEVQRKRPEEHVNWFTEKKLIAMLRRAGFEKAYRSEYGKSFAPQLRNLGYFDNTCPAISLYIEAIKD